MVPTEDLKETWKGRRSPSTLRNCTEPAAGLPVELSSHMLSPGAVGICKGCTSLFCTVCFLDNGQRVQLVERYTEGGREEGREGVTEVLQILQEITGMFCWAEVVLHPGVNIQQGKGKKDEVKKGLEFASSSKVAMRSKAFCQSHIGLKLSYQYTSIGRIVTQPPPQAAPIQPMSPATQHGSVPSDRPSPRISCFHFADYSWHFL